MTGKLTVIPTPIGNLRDITLRALDTLQAVDLLLCEDTRHTGKLLKEYEIRVPLLSYHKFNEQERVSDIAEEIRAGGWIGLVSDAGIPGISDPGEILIREVIRRGLAVEVLPGANAALTALVGSGLPMSPFLYLGFLSSDRRVSRKQWALLKEAQMTVVLYESPRRIRKTVGRLYEELGNRDIAIGRELSKLHEEYIRADLKTLAKAPERITEKGEMVLLIGGADAPKAEDPEPLLKEALAELPLSAAVKKVAKESGLPRNELYAAAVQMKEAEDGSDA